MHYRLNLSDSKISGKDTYYILPNDVVVVEPLKAISTSYQILHIQQSFHQLQLSLPYYFLQGLLFMISN